MQDSPTFAPTAQRTEAYRAIAVSLAAVLLGVFFCLWEPQFFWKDDFQTQHIGGAQEILRAWSEGSFPLLARWSWQAGALGGEFQYGIFSIFITLADIIVMALHMPLATSAAALAILHLTVTTLGGYLLARDYGVRHSLATAAGFVAAFHGYNIAWNATNWFPAATSYAWLPWFWLGLRRLTTGRVTFRAVLGTAIAFYLLITAGWPFTVLMAAVVAFWLIGGTLIERRFRDVAWSGAALAIGAMLAAPSVLMLIEYLPSTARPTATQFGWLVRANNWLGLVLPTMPSDWMCFNQERTHRSIEMAGGVIPLLGLLTAVFFSAKRLVRDCAMEIRILATAMLLSMLPSISAFRWSFRWLPLVMLSLAVVGVYGMELFLSNRPAPGSRGIVVTRWNLGVWLLGSIVITFLLSFTTDEKTLILIGILVLAGVVWTAIEILAPAPVRDWAPFVVALVSIASTYLLVGTVQIVPVWKIDSAQMKSSAPFNPNIRYLFADRWIELMRDDVRLGNARSGNPLFRPGNLPMLADLNVVNGYSPMRPAGLQVVVGLQDDAFVIEAHLKRLLTLETQPGGALDHMSVNGLVVHRGVLRSLKMDSIPGWREVAEIGGEVLFHRETPIGGPVRVATTVQEFKSATRLLNGVIHRTTAAMPWALLSNRDSDLEMLCGNVTLSNVRMERLRSTVDVDTTRCAGTAAVVFTRPWYPGFFASVNGAPAPVLRADDLMPAVIVQPGTRGTIVLTYRPRSLVAGVAVTVAGGFALVLCWFVLRRRR